MMMPKVPFVLAVFMERVLSVLVAPKTPKPETSLPAAMLPLSVLSLALLKKKPPKLTASVARLPTRVFDEEPITTNSLPVWLPVDVLLSNLLWLDPSQILKPLSWLPVATFWVSVLPDEFEIENPSCSLRRAWLALSSLPDDPSCTRKSSPWLSLLAFPANVFACDCARSKPTSLALA